MTEDLGKVLHEMVYKGVEWPWTWNELSIDQKAEYRNTAYEFAAYVENELTDCDEAIE